MDRELERIAAAEIKISAFYVDPCAEDGFTHYAEKTGGDCSMLDAVLSKYKTK